MNATEKKQTKQRSVFGYVTRTPGNQKNNSKSVKDMKQLEGPEKKRNHNKYMGGRAIISLHACSVGPNPWQPHGLQVAH